jgi:hypothetical protein
VPGIGIIVSTALATPLVLVQASRGHRLCRHLRAIVGLATLTPPSYAFCARWRTLSSRRGGNPEALRDAPVEAIAVHLSPSSSSTGAGPKLC